MLHYTKRSWEVTNKLLGTRRAMRDLYDIFEFYRAPTCNKTNTFTTKQLVKLSGVTRKYIVPAINDLAELGLILRIEPFSQGVWRFKLPLLPTSSIVNVMETTKEEQHHEKTGTDDSDLPFPE